MGDLEWASGLKGLTEGGLAGVKLRREGEEQSMRREELGLRKKGQEEELGLKKQELGLKERTLGIEQAKPLLEL